jgi:hypothetical protein
MSNPQDNPSLLFAPKDNSDQKIKQSGYNYSTCTVTAKSPNCTITSRVVGANNGKYLADLSYLMTNPESTGLLKPIPYTITGGSPTPNPSPTPTPQPPKKSYAYISNSKGNSYTQCIVDADGIIDKSSCSTITPTGAGQLNAPTGIAFNENYAYILNNSDNSYTQCNVGVSGIESASCTTITPKDDAENPILNRPTGIIFSGSYAYITSNRRDSYTQCNVVASGIESASCNTITPTGLGALDGPFRMAISGNYAYFVNNKNNSYTQCNVGASGIESASCIVNQ